MNPDGRQRMPVLFIGHGNPMNAIESNAFSFAWEEMGRKLIKPDGILCVSAHWETNGTGVTAMEFPRTIHDFSGFPEELFSVEYKAPGSPELAKRVQELCRSTPVRLDEGWGLDHGTWSVLCRMFPAADVPVVQLSLDRRKPAPAHYALAKKLSILRDENILILGSGNIVHNLGMLNWDGSAHDWAREFDLRVARMILDRDHKGIIDLPDRSEESRRAIPTPEHFLPLLYCLALQESQDEISFFAEEVVLGALSMRSLLLSPAGVEN